LSQFERSRMAQKGLLFIPEKTSQFISSYFQCQSIKRANLKEVGNS